jgi:hypothetical protein
MHAECAVQDAFSVRSRYNRLVRILVVEDEGRLAKRLSAALGVAGYVVDCAR